MNPLISLIIPVYDVSPYLRKCITSVLNQSLEDIEIILVNDCSPDPIDELICKEYSHSDQRVKYFSHNENKRQGGARNTGIDNATGDYIWFIDSDDFIDTNACEFLYNLAQQTHAEIIAFSATSHINGNLDLSKHVYYRYKRDADILDQYIKGRHFIALASAKESFHVSPCLHLFKRELFSECRFRENVFFEDVDLIPIIIYNADTIFCSQYAPYYRLLRDNSVTQREVDSSAIIDKISATKSIIKYISTSKHFNKKSDDPLVGYATQLFLNLEQAFNAFTNITKNMEDKFDSLTFDYTNMLNHTNNTNSINGDHTDTRQSLRTQLSRYFKNTLLWKSLRKVKKLVFRL